jgi:hypothetical protein
MKQLLHARNQHRIILMLVILFMSSVLLSCNNDALNGDQINEIDFSLVLMDENGMEGAVFEKGTDIPLALKLINDSEEEIEWQYSYGCMLYESEEFLLVYMKNNETNSAYVPIGRPYQWPVNCYAMDFAPQIYQPGESYVTGIPWRHNSDNQPLGIGMYYVKADFSVTMHGKTRNWELKTEFEMK